LGEILNVSLTLLVNAQFEIKDSPEDQPTDLKEHSPPFVCSLVGYQADAWVRLVEVPPEAIGFMEPFLSVACRFRQTPLTWALVAGVAAGLATLQGSNITDNSGFFTRVNEQSPDEFCRTLRVATPQQDVEAAAATMYAAMPKSAEISEWLANNPWLKDTPNQ
jgi:hypothetical protein